MKGRMTWVFMLMAILCMIAVVAVVADNFRATISGSFAGATVSVTNTTGSKMTLSGIALTKIGTDWNTATNALVTLKNVTGQYMLVNQAATNTVLFLSNDGIPWERDGIISFSLGCGAASTNYYEIYVK